MTNKEKFIEVFGIDVWKQMISFSGVDEDFKEFWDAEYAPTITVRWGEEE